jgi:hypothetical protein
MDTLPRRKAKFHKSHLTLLIHFYQISYLIVKKNLKNHQISAEKQKNAIPDFPGSGGNRSQAPECGQRSRHATIAVENGFFAQILASMVFFAARNANLPGDLLELR